MENENEENYLIDANTTDVVEIINTLNEKLHKKCDKCRLSITQEKDQDIQNIAHYGDFTKTDDPVLCFYYENKCISSLIISRDDDKIQYIAKTNTDFENKKINTLLIAVLFIIANKMNKNIKELVVEIAKDVSAYILIKNFDANLWGFYDKMDINTEFENQEDEEGAVFQPFPSFKNEDKTFSNIEKKVKEYEEIAEGNKVYCIADIDSNTQKKANELFDEIIEKLKITGGKRTRKNRKRKSNKSKRKYKKKQSI